MSKDKRISTLSGKRVWRYVVLLGVVSLLVRLLVWWPVATQDTRLAGDEWGYWWRSEGALRVMDHFLHGRLPDTASWDLLYQGRNPSTGGWWPPLHPIVLAVGRETFGSTIAGARLSIVILSTLTTPLVYLVTRKIFDKKSALIGAAIHIFYPAFVGFSHLLWTETLYIFILFAVLYLVILLSEADGLRRCLLLSFGVGLLMGFGGLSRAAFLPYLFILPLWVGVVFHLRGERRLAKLLPVLMGIVSICVLLPWEMMLFFREGHFVLLSSTGTFNFYRMSAGLPPDEAMIILEEYAQRHSVSLNAAASTLALEHLKENPWLYATQV